MKILSCFCLSLILLSNLGFSAPNSISIYSDTGFKKPFVIPATTVVISHEKVPLMIDLGFSVGDADIVLKKDEAKTLGVHGHLPKVCGYSQSGKTCYLTASIPEITIGHKIYHQVKTLVALNDWGGGSFFKNMQKGSSYQNGVITLAFLRKYNVYFDFPNKKMLLFNHENFAQAPIFTWHMLPFTLPNGVMTTLSLNGQSLHVVWDTALMPSMLSSAVVQSQKVVDCAAVYRVFMPNPKCLSVDTQKMKNTFLVLDAHLPPSAGIDGFIGSDYFYQHSVFMDFAHQVLYIKYPI